MQMPETIIKRTGEREPFNADKIRNAARKAFEAVGAKYTDTALDYITELVTSEIDAKRIVEIEDIQDAVERKLMQAGYHDVARAYIKYRYKRQLVRRQNTTDESIMALLGNRNPELAGENSNKDTTVAATQRDYIAGEVSRDMTRRLFLPEHLSAAHDEGIFHFHDGDYFIQDIFNCFSKKTEFVTSDGIRMFSDFKDGEEVTVLAKDGQWRPATVRRYGKQVMNDVTFKSGRSVKKVTCTPNHRWILEDGSVTTNLKIGDQLAPLQAIAENLEPKTKHDMDVWCFGFIIGDGSDMKSGFQIRLCNDKVKYLGLFIKAGYAESGQSGGDIFLYKKTAMSKQAFLTASGWRYMSLRDKQMLFAGYYAADGCTDRNAIHTADDRIAAMANEISAVCGYHVSSHTIEKHDTNFKTDATLHTIHFRMSQNVKNRWTVDNIKPHHGSDAITAWCVEEPVTHSFTLANGMVTGNCCLLRLGDMLDNGTVINKKRIDSPNTFRVACTVTGQIIGNIGSNQYGGQSLDTVHLGKYLRKSRDKFERRIRKNAAKNGIPAECLEAFVRDELADEIQEELSAGVQTLQYQINTFMTTNGQAPFVTLFLYLRHDDPYLKENAMIIKEILEQRIKGIKNEDGIYTTPAFPKLVYVLDEFNCLEGGEYDWLTRIAVKCTSVRMYPDYISAKKMRENYAGNVFSPMGCRSFLAPWKDENGEYQFEGRFNQGVVSINLPQIGIIAAGDEDKFWSLLDERLQLCFEALMCRHDALLNVTSDVSPLHWQHGAIARLPAHAPIRPYLFNGYSSISLGYIGLYECTVAMKGCSHTKKKGQEFALRVMRRLREACDGWKAETNIGFALYGTPAESLCYRFARIDRQKFGDIPNITDKGYYTNSYHVDVREKIDLFKKFTFEDQFQPISSGGCISYAEIPNMRNNLEALETCVRFIYDNIQYAEFNTKDDVCGVCGFHGEIEVNPDGEWECPNCRNTDQRRMTIVRRTCGYLGENYWNKGKTKEIASRVEHL